MNYQYSNEAQKRISALGPTTVTTFIEDIPLNIRKDAYKILPKVQGFRPNSPAEVKEKQKRLIKNLTHPKLAIQKTPDWMSFAYIWCAWGRLKLGESFPVEKDIDSTSESGLAFFIDLENLFPDAEREIMEQLFTFSCFPEHVDLQKILANFQTAKVIAREKMINRLVPRLEEIEQSFDKIKNNTKEVFRRLDHFEPNFNLINNALEENTKQIDHNSNAITLLRADIDSNFKKYNHLHNAVNDARNYEKEIKKNIEKVNSQVLSLEKYIQELSTHVNTLDLVKNELRDIKSVIADLLGREKETSISSEDIDTLIEKVAALESMSLNRGDASDAKEINRLIEYEVEGELVNIHSVKDVCDLVAFNLKAVGVIKATEIARQITATFVAGQIVQFSGSLANLIADAVAAAIGGATYHEWRVPIGLRDGDKGTAYVEKIRNNSGCLILKGVNLSAFEIYGTEIRDIVIRRQYGFLEFGRLALIATWTQGPATFPDGGTVAELGPLFDTDTFKMRGVVNKFTPWKYGHLVKENWSILEGLEFDESFSKIDDLKEILNEVDFFGGNLWRRSVVHFLELIRAIPGSNAEYDLHFLLISWVIPWAKILGGPVTELNRIAIRELVEQREISD